MGSPRRPRRAEKPQASRPPARSTPAGPRLAGDPSPGARTGKLAPIVAASIGAALAAFLLFMITGPHRIGDYMAETDFYGAYAGGAKLIQHGHLVPGRYGVIGPVYEILLGLTGFVVPNLFVAAELLSLLATLATLGFWFAILWRRMDIRIALAAVALYAVNPFVFRYGYSATTDAVSVAIQSACLWLLLAREGPRAAFLAGLLAAAAFLTRYNAIFLLPAGLLVFALRPAGSRRAGALRFAGGFIAPVVPWVLFCLASGTRFSFQLHHNIAYEVYARAKGIPWDNYQRFLQPQFHNLWDVIRRDPAAFTARMATNVVGHLRDDGLRLLGGWTAAAAVAGVLVLFLERRGRSLLPVFLPGVLLFLSLVPVFYSERYSLALVPFYVALGGLAFGSPLAAFPVRGLWVKALVLVLPLAFTIRTSVTATRFAISQLPTEVLEIAETLRERKAPGDRVIARKPHVAFHAGVEAAPFPFADSLPDLARGVKRERARWLFVSWPEVETRPAFWHLLDTTGVVPGLTVRRVTRPHPAVLYEVGPGFGTIPAWYRNDTLRTWHFLRARTLVDQNDPKLFAARGNIERALGRMADARASLQRAVGLDPGNLDAFLSLGAVGYETGDFALAIGALERAAQTHPESSDARIGLGWAYLAAGRDAAAAAAWKPEVTTTRDPATLRRMRELFTTLGDAETATAAERALAGVGGR